MIYTIINIKDEAKIKSKDSKYLIFIPSGKFHGWDKQTKDNEFFNSISELLNETYSIILLPFISKNDDKNSDDTFIESQYAILKQFMLSNISIFKSCTSLSFVSLSIGSHVLLKFLADESFSDIKPDRCILISLVLENKVDIYSDVSKLFLLYGSNDWVGYISKENELKIISPDTYSKNTLNLLSTVKYTKKDAKILENHGHFLENSDTQSFVESSRITYQTLIQ